MYAYFDARNDEKWAEAVKYESKSGTYNTNSDGSFHKPLVKQSAASWAASNQGGVTNAYYPETIQLSDDVVFVRPTGNPLTKNQWIAMFKSDDVSLLSNKMVDFYKVDVSPSNDWALVCYSTHAKFTYKGVENDDISVFTVLMKRVNNTWLMSHLQRSTGRLPTDSMPVFN